MIRVHFAYIDTERYYDYVKTSAGDSWSGYLTDIWSSWAYNDTMTISIETDGTTASNGYKIDKVEYYYDIDISQNWKTYVSYNLTDWNNTGKILNKVSNYQISAPTTAKAIRVHFREIDTEKDSDIITLSGSSNSESIHSSRSGIWSSWHKGNTLNIKFETDGSTHSKGFVIDGYEYATTLVFPGESVSNHFINIAINPHQGDGERRLAERKNYLPSSGNISFDDYFASFILPGNTIQTNNRVRSTRLEFSWNSSRLSNLQVDGNDTIEMEVTFQNRGIIGTDLANRPTSAFYAWMKPYLNISEPGSVPPGFDVFNDLNTAVPGSGSLYFYKTNLPACYADTFFCDNIGTGEGNVAFAIGVSDTQMLVADRLYYYEILGNVGFDPNGNVVPSGIFSISGQRGYRYEPIALVPTPMAHMVFNEEHEDRTLTGDNIIGLTNEYYANDPLPSGNYFNLNEIISMIDSRTSPSLLANENNTFRWNAYGDVYGTVGNASQQFMNCTRLWNAWNTNNMNTYARIH